ncbi:MAG: hypothetical protein M1436_07240, partial [Acidobacteria bacterium]|nr:hypothetical protein [Acidobacteriota bacterium]
AYAEVQPSATAPLSPPALPGAPKGPGRFGGYYTRLRYTDEWEYPWRVGDAADVVVRFDGAPYQFILWRGTSYVPVWATENGIWYNNQFFETGTGEIETSAEPMADKQARYSFVRILESSAARVVVRWRYAPVNLNYDMVHTGELTGWGDWVEETFTIYPDATSVRKVQVWSSTPVVVEGKGPGKGGFRQWQESIVINAAGARPEDNIEPEAVTLANLKGESHTYSWEKDAPGEYVRLDEERRKALSGELRVFPEYQDRHKWLMQPDHANIQVVNLKAKYRPYVIVDPRSAIGSYAGEIIRERSMFPWWNHWPVSQQVRSNGRWAVAPDRVSHSSLTSIYRRASSAPP